MAAILIQQDNLLVSAIRREIEAARRVMVVSHIRPDGDAVGSVLGLGLALEAAGKDVQMVLQDGVPDNLRHLPGSDRVVSRPTGVVDLVIVVDVSDLPRLGSVLDDYDLPDISIDHHITNEGFAHYNLVESEAVATAEIIARYLADFGLSVSEEVANALLTGLVTDTIGFRTMNVNSGPMRIVADLIDAGGSLSEMYFPALVQRTFDGAKYWGAGLSKLQRQDRLVWTTLSLEDRKNSGYNGNDDADLINVMSAIRDTDVAMIFVEQTPSRVKISWRSCGQPFTGVDVSEIAKKFGGGGHRAAAGAEVDGALVDVLNYSIGITQDYLADKILPPISAG